MIEVDALVKHHGTTPVLKGISLTVGKGDVAVIIGPSGGGKSTFLRCLNGLEPFDGGHVRIGDHLLRPGPPGPRDEATLCAVRRRVGFVFQHFNLFPHLSVLENVIEAPLVVLREPRESAVARALSLLDRVGMKPHRDASPATLSGGQRQRVAIARALAMNPDIVLFDEPTSALDPMMAREVLSVMTDLSREGQTMVVVTHSLSFARSAATHVHVFAGGHDVEHGPPGLVLDRPEHEATRALLSASL